MDNFETLDFAEFYSETPKTKSEFCERLVVALGKNGFVKLVNHGIPKKIIEQAFDISTSFFHMSMKDKMLAPHPPTANPHRGFSPMGMENIAAVANFGTAETNKVSLELQDMKESYDIGSERDPIWKNIWPPAHILPPFEPFMQNFFNICYLTQQEILKAIAIGLHLNPDTVTEMHLQQSNEMRLTHYPEIKLSDLFIPSTDTNPTKTPRTRIAQHTDFGSITLLFQDSVGGLEVEDQVAKGTYKPIESADIDEMILNAGDCLQKWTANRICSARHRVHAPTGKSMYGGGVEANGVHDLVSERFSIAYFAKPDRHAILRPLSDEWLVNGEGDMSDSSGMTAGEFQLMRINGTY